MLFWRMILLATLCSPAGAAANAAPPTKAPAARALHLKGLTSDEAGALIESLTALQRRLRRGDKLLFELLSGAPAASPMARLSPREAFLRMPFDTAFIIERVPTDNRSWQPFKLAIAPNGPGQPIWDIEVVVEADGRVERVQMVYKAPAPF
jgi:hypothetical protein